jgi:alkyldihydroxyacetonephosphate synthase
VSSRRRKHWGWGYEDQQPAPAQIREWANALADRLGLPAGEVEQPVALEAVRLASPRLAPPAALADICETDVHARATHALGKSYSDVVRGFRGQFEHPPDLVARPRSEDDVERVLEWCSAERVAAIPFGGGTSVVGGVNPDVGPGFNGVLSLDLGALDRVLEVDPVSRAALIQAGALGPQLETQLGEHSLTLRHFPQSFEFSTLGGWIATRAAGHFATVWTHIEDLVESVRAITPVGAWESRRLPGSGAGVSPDRMLAGSEGALGVITQAWMRVQPRPTRRASAGVTFNDFHTGAECVRAISQAGLYPSNCRLLDAGEAGLTGASDGSHALLVLGFESVDHAVDSQMARALAICAEHGGQTREGSGAAEEGGVSSWARGVPGGSVPARRDGGGGHFGGDVRDGDHVGSLWRVPRTRDGGGRGGAARELRRRGQGVLPLHTYLPGRPGALLHGAGAGAQGRRGGAVGGDQAGGLRRDPGGRRHDHPPPRGGARSPLLV